LTQEIIEYVCQKIIEAINPCQIVIFSSQAQGGGGAGSDLDLLVVQDISPSDRQVRRQLEKLFLDRRFGLDLIVRTPQEVAKNMADGNPFYTEHIFGRGIIAYRRPDANPTG
jgi:predicted nucleotidyltransferase